MDARSSGGLKVMGWVEGWLPKSVFSLGEA